MAELTSSSSSRAIVQAELLERILGQNDLMPISYLLLGQHRARSVGRIHIRNKNGQSVGFGTGFLVSPRLLLTNNHVLEDAQTASFSEIEFDFEVDLAGNVRQTVRFPLKPADFFLTDRSLDFSLVAVAPSTGSDREPRDWGWHRLPEEDGLIVKGEYVSIIQHPNGEAKQIALRENQVIDLLDDFAHYHTDTAPGSSGSPVFNDQWEVVALHHSGVPERDGNGNILAVDGRKWEPWMGDHRIKWIANEGVSGSRIVAFVKKANLASEQKHTYDPAEWRRRCRHPDLDSPALCLLEGGDGGGDLGRDGPAKH
jgi:S1-C subfamily serine protease